MRLLPDGSEHWRTGEIIRPYANISSHGPAYQFEAGTLVPGFVNIYGHFIPAVHAPTIQFADYTYSPTAVCIWKMPG